MIFVLILASIKISGVVLNIENQKPVPYAAIEFIETGKGTYADENGRFEIEIEKGKYTLRISALGFEKKKVALNLKRDRELKIRLRPIPIRLKEIIVTPGTHAIEEEIGPGKGTMSRMDIVMMPGAATDPFWALKTLPGVGGETDNAVLAIQGGNPDEIGIYVNGLEVPHPFHYEGSGGGLFTFISENLLEKANLYTAGYPSTYGNALSGILDIKLKKGENNRGGSFGLSMTEASFTVYGNSYLLLFSRSYTELIGRFLKRESFTVYPKTYDLQGIWSYNLGKSSYISFFILTGWDATGLDLSKTEDFEGEYRENSLKGVGGLNLTSLLGPWTLFLSLGGNFYKREMRVGEPWSWDFKERELESRLVLERGLGKRLLIQTGVELSNHWADVKAIFPEDSLLWKDPDSPKDTLKRKGSSYSFGSFILSRYALSPKWFVEGGLREDFFEYNSNRSIDPRISLAYIDSSLTFRFGGGIYHQQPAYFYLDSVFGNPDLPPMKAYHGVLSVEKSFNGVFFIETQLFYKKYINLPIDTTGTYKPYGKGRAYGFQILLRKFRGRTSGWVAYTLSISTRAKDGSLKEYRADYDKPHIITLVLQSYLGKGIQLGIKARYATGRPYTPVLDASKVEETWVPVLGETNSERYPYYLRVDVRITKITSIKDYPLILFLELLNVMDRKNIVSWSYSMDYTEKRGITNFRFLPVGGLVLIF